MKKRLVTLLIVSAMLLSGCVNIEPEWDGESEGTEVTGEITETVPQTDSGDGEKEPEEPHSNVIEKDGLRFMSMGAHYCAVTAAADFSDTVLVIPSESPLGEKVVRIAMHAFQGCETLMTVKIPEGVQSIGEYAFEGCTSMATVILPDSVKDIGTHAFQDCETLMAVKIPEGVQSIGEYAFEDCTSMATVILPDSVKQIGANAFRGCKTLMTVKIPEGVKTIEEHAFAGCASLTTVILPDSVEEIGKWTFSGCSSLQRIQLSKGVKSIGTGIFQACESLEFISVDSDNPFYHSEGNCLIETASKTLIEGCKNSVIPSNGSVEHIGVNAFRDRQGLVEIVIPEGVKTIQDNAFKYCFDLEQVSLPDSLISLGFDAFCATSIKQLILPKNITQKNLLDPFYGCGKLESIAVDVENPVYHSVDNCLIETESKELRLGCENSVIPTDGSVTDIGVGAFSFTSITDLVIPSGVLSIGSSAFWECQNLKSITIPNTVMRIESYAFAHCSSLTDIYFEGTVEEWRTIDKAGDFGAYGGEYFIIHCTDGEDVFIRIRNGK